LTKKPLSTARWRRVKELFREALDRDPDQRDGWLEAQCAGDPELRREVETLLATDVLRASDLAVSVEDRDAAVASIAMTQRIGPYRILREIGHGGMATVFLAVRDDAEFDQRVAIKVVRGTLGADALRRLRIERQILASLEHANIAHLIDGGTTAEGVPYLVMEYIDGVPIDQYCDQHHLSIAQRLELFCRVCDAVNHAHHSFVVHRDIKPSNILVTADGTPKLLDFGIAKLLDESMSAAPVTLTGFRAMTPDYASPEQVRGEPITTASDVYSLGALLYELLTGKRPLTFRTRQSAEIVLVVCTAEPRKPSTVVEAGRAAKSLAGDLDVIVLTALAKEPLRRYSTAAAFADDVRRHLEGLPVHARPSTWRYRSARFAKRHRAGVAFAAIFLVVVMAFGMALAQQMRSVSQQRDTAEQVTAMLLDMYGSFDPSSAGGGRLSSLEVLDRGAARVDSELANQPELQARMLDALGTLYGALGQAPRAEAVLRRSLLIREGLGRDDLATAGTLVRLADSLRNQGRVPEAEPAAQRALDINLRLAGSDALSTAEAYNTLGLVKTLLSRAVEGAALIAPAVDIWRREKGLDSEEFAGGVTNLLRSWRERGDYPAAGRFTRAELLRVERVERQRLATRRGVFGDRNFLTAESMMNVGRLLQAMERYTEAETFVRDALEARRTVLGDGHPAVADAKHHLASVLQDQGRHAEAETLYRDALQLVENATPRDTQRVIYFANIASLMEAMDRLPEAEDWLKKALELRQDVEGRERVALARTERALARVLIKQGRANDAKPLIADAVAISREWLGDADAETQLSVQFEQQANQGRVNTIR
jgi:serine/threonine protein kinase/tetratricopeptide (TPR) repeat protein